MEARNELLEAEPVLVRISAAKRMRDRAEQDARSAGAPSVQRKSKAQLKPAMIFT
jgi:chlorophyllide a reductase subunit Z